MFSPTCFGPIGQSSGSLRHRFPEDGPGGPKHVEANMRYFNCTF